MAAGSDKPVLGTFLGMRGVADPRTGEGPGHVGSVPAYPMPEDAVLALDQAVRYAAWREADKGERVSYDDIDRHAAFAVIDGVLHRLAAMRAYMRKREVLVRSTTRSRRASG